MSTKYDNFIYINICELIYKFFKTTKFSTFHNYCHYLSIKILNDELDEKDNKVIVFVIKGLDNIFSLRFDESFKYIEKFLIEEKYKTFFDIVRLTHLIDKNNRWF